MVLLHNHSNLYQSYLCYSYKQQLDSDGLPPGEGGGGSACVLLVFVCHILEYNSFLFTTDLIILVVCTSIVQLQSAQLVMHPMIVG